MNKTYLLIILQLFGNFTFSQNLIPNGGFEQYYGCPNDYSQIDSALFWTSPTKGTPDYFNECAPSFPNVPYAVNGFQYAKGGVAFAGIYRFSQLDYNPPTNYREYIETPLLSTLSSGTCYNFEMYISLAEASKYNCPNISVYFSDTLLKDTTTVMQLNAVPQINNGGGLFPDTTNWILFTGTYVANGSENFLIIGNFENDQNTPLTIANSNFRW